MRAALEVCCRRAARGHVAAAPPTNVMNSRRFIAFAQAQDHCLELNRLQQGNASNGMGSVASLRSSNPRPRMSAWGLGCVKTHGSGKCGKYNSPTRHRAICRQYDLTLAMRNRFEIFLRAPQALEFSHGLGQKRKGSVGAIVFRFTPELGHWPARSARPKCAKCGLTRCNKRDSLFDHLSLHGRAAWAGLPTPSVCGVSG
jgi:hypothetical protein